MRAGPRAAAVSFSAAEVAPGRQVPARGSSQRAQAEALVEQKTDRPRGARALAGADERWSSGVGPRLSGRGGICGEREDAGGHPDHRGSYFVSGRKAARQGAKRQGTFSAARIAARVAELGRAITRAYQGRRVDVVVMMDRGFVFAADLIRHVEARVVFHFFPEDVHDVNPGGHARREGAFGKAPAVKGRDVLVVDAVLDSGVTQDFLLRRLGEIQPRSLRMAVLLDKPEQRPVGLEPDYIWFRTASNGVWVGYGLAAANGMGRHQK